MKKLILIIPVLVLSIFALAQPHLQTTVNLVGGKIRIAVKAVGGDVVGSPSGATFCIRIPIANTTATIASPSSPVNGPVGSAGAGILDASRLPLQVQTANTTDANYKYFIFLMTGGNSNATYTNGTPYELMEITWAAPTQQNCQVGLVCKPNGNIGGGNSVLEGQWNNYIEVGGNQVSFTTDLFFASTIAGNSGATLAQHGGADNQDYSNGTAFVTTDNPLILILPVNLINFSGYKNGNKNRLLWTTGSEENNRGFDVQRSTDGVNYSVIGFVNSQVLGGYSSTSLDYTFDDNNPVGKKNYYRLNQKDIDGRNKLSNIVVIKGDKPAQLAIGGLFPNPARDKVSMIIEAPQRDKVMIIVTDMSGKMVKQQQANVDVGSNTVPVDIAALASGSYLVKLTCVSSDCETAVGKFNKQ